MSTQREIPTLGPMRPPQPVDDRLVCACKSVGMALSLSIQLSPYHSAAQAAERFGIQKAQLSRIMSGQAHFCPDWTRRWDECVQNTCLSQYIVAMIEGRAGVSEIDQLERRLAELKASA